MYNIVIRENIPKHVKDLKEWLAATMDQKLEEMAEFFAARLDGYEEHMGVWAEAYKAFPKYLPKDCRKILDLGCGTGLELDEIWKMYPDLSVTGIDLSKDMLAYLKNKHPDKDLTVICADYFQHDLGKEVWDAAVSFESLHHFLIPEKTGLYRKLYESLKPGGIFLLGDYIACCQEEEEVLMEVWAHKRKRDHIPEDQFIHFDIPLTLEHEIGCLQEAGFTDISVPDSIAGATFIIARK